MKRWFIWRYLICWRLTLLSSFLLPTSKVVVEVGIEEGEGGWSVVTLHSCVGCCVDFQFEVVIHHHPPLVFAGDKTLYWSLRFNYVDENILQTYGPSASNFAKHFAKYLQRHDESTIMQKVISNFSKIIAWPHWWLIVLASSLIPATMKEYAEMIWVLIRKIFISFPGYILDY